jgi:hypothetical protein
VLFNFSNFLAYSILLLVIKLGELSISYFILFLWDSLHKLLQFLLVLVFWLHLCRSHLTISCDNNLLSSLKLLQTAEVLNTRNIRGISEFKLNYNYKLGKDI